MIAPPPVEFGGTDEELEKYLLEFARGIGGWVGREGGGFRVSAGSSLSTNPNTIALSWRVARDGNSLALSPAVRSFPWTRAKSERVAAFRQGQLADFLTMRARGGGKESFDFLRFREPFAAFGSGVAAITASFAWVAVGLAAAMAAAVASATLASAPLMSLAIGEIQERARLVQAAGAVALPNPDQPLSIWGSAFVFAVPIAFLAAFVHGSACVASELWFRADRLPQASFFFIAILLAAALFPFTPFLAVPCALAVPLVTHVGYTLVWGRRRERVREGPRPRKGFLVIAAALTGILLASLVPAAAEGQEWTDRLALFRDRFMLGNPIGKAAGAVYYRHTLVGAELLKQFYSTDPDVAQRSVRTAAVEDPAAQERLRALGFTIVREAPAGVDLRIPKGKIPTPAEIDALAHDAYRGTLLREACGFAWHALYYAGPLFAFVLLAGAICPGVSILFRRLKRPLALGVLGGVFLLSAGVVLSSYSGTPEAWERLQALRHEPGPGPIAAGLASPAVTVRHEAAFQAFHHPDPSLGAPLLRAADDGDVRVRLWACAALGKTKHPEALAKLIARLDDPELFVRYRAAEGLGFLGRSEAIEPLLKMARERSWYEGLYALEALRRIEPKTF